MAASSSVAGGRRGAIAYPIGPKKNRGKRAFSAPIRGLFAAIGVFNDF